jgi:hypothetical protein
MMNTPRYAPPLAGALFVILFVALCVALWATTRAGVCGVIHSRTVDQTRKKEHTMLKLTIRYARYILSSLATVGFMGAN